MKKGILLLLLLLMACAPTAPKPPNADDEPMQTVTPPLAAGELSDAIANDPGTEALPIGELLGVPERVIASFSGMAGGRRATVTLDADTIVPNVMRVPLYEVGTRTLTAEEAERAVGAALGGRPYYEYNVARGRKEAAVTASHRLAQVIEAYRSNVYGDACHDYDVLLERAQAVMQAEMAVYESIPDAGPMKPLSKSDFDGAFCVANAGNDAFFCENGTLFYRRSGAIVVPVRALRAAETEEEQKLLERAAALLAALDGDGFYAQGIACADEADRRRYGSEAGIEDGVYVAAFSPLFDGIPLYADIDDAPGESRASLGTDAAKSPMETASSLFSASEQPHIRMGFRNGTITWAYWSRPLTVVRTVQDSASLLPFSDVTDALEREILFDGLASFDEGGDAPISVAVRSIRFVYVCVPDAETDARFLVPAWVVSGSIAQEGAGSGEGNSLNLPLLLINAIDGTRIAP